MITRQKLGLVMMAFALVAGLVLQAVGASLYSTEKIQNLQVDPAQEHLTAVLLLIFSMNWAVVIPLLIMFGCGVAFLLVPPQQREDEPQWVKITYVH